MNSRCRSRLGFRCRAECLGRAINCIQAVISTTSATRARQTRFWANLSEH
jgi:hypothetical protein